MAAATANNVEGPCFSRGPACLSRCFVSACALKSIFLTAETWPLKSLLSHLSHLSRLRPPLNLLLRDLDKRPLPMTSGPPMGRLRQPEASAKRRPRHFLRRFLKQIH